VTDGWRLGGDAPVVGTWVKLPAPEVVEIVAQAGFDAVIIDLEHTMLGLETVSTMIALARLAGVRCLVRVPDHGHSVIQRVLDAGASGVVVPQVDTVEQARGVVACAKFPPAGRRGLSNSARAGGWGSVPPTQYMQKGDADSVVVVQLESEAAIRHGSEIAAVPGVDCVLVGGADLAASMGCAPSDTRYVELLDAFEKDCLQRDVVLGAAVGTDAGAGLDLLRRGYRLVVVGSDATLLRSAAATLVNGIRD
jgi:2-keto-3-deoxy-L-rhamnonate aldolase RhmA